MSTYVGFQTGGLPGGIIATLALITPSIIIIEIISKILARFKESKIVEYVFYGIRPASTALIAVAGLSVIRTALLFEGEIININYVASIMCVALFILIRKFKIHPLVYIAISAVLGIVLKF